MDNDRFIHILFSSEGDTVLPKEYADILFWISFLIGFTAIYALIKKKYDISVICFVIFITSLNYWREPKTGFRRNIDIVAVILGFIYLFSRAIMLNIQSLVFWICCTAVMLTYAMSWVSYGYGYVFESTIVHCLVHLFGNATAILYCSSL